MLSQLRQPTSVAKPRNRCLAISAGKSISADDLNTCQKYPKTSAVGNNTQSEAPAPSDMPTPLPPKPLSWQDIHENLSACKSYEDIKKLVTHNRDAIDASELSPCIFHTVVSTKMPVDQLSLSVMPNDVSYDDNLKPVSTVGDGNCFPRSLSVLAYGHQNNHQEMRARLVCEAVRNKDNYLDNDYLRKGATLEHKRASLPVIYAQYSEHYIPLGSQFLSSSQVEEIYEQEVLGLCKDGNYMGVWQLFQAANIFHLPLVSVYPKQTSPNIRKDLHRIMYPLKAGPYTRRLYMMWTYYNKIRQGFPRHFVPLLPLYSCDARATPDEEIIHPTGILNMFVC